MESNLRETAIPCARCQTPTAVTDELVNRVLSLNRALRARGEQPLKRSEVVLCEACYPEHRREQDERWRLANEMLSAIRGGSEPPHTVRDCVGAYGCSREQFAKKVRAWLRSNGYQRELSEAIEVAKRRTASGPDV